MDNTYNTISSIINKNDCKIDCVVDCFTACAKDWSRAKPYTPSSLSVEFYNKGDRGASALEDEVLEPEALDDYITIDISDNSSKTYYKDIEYKDEDEYEIQNKGARESSCQLDEPSRGASVLVEYEIQNKGARESSCQLAEPSRGAEALVEYEIQNKGARGAEALVEYEIQNKGFKEASAKGTEALVNDENKKNEKEQFEKIENIKKNISNFIIFTTNTTNENNNFNNNFADYVYKYMRDTEIYNKLNKYIYVKLEYIGNFKKIYNKAYNFTDKLASRLDYKYIHRSKILKIIDNIYYLMEHNMLEFKFNFFEYDLYSVNNVNELYIIKIKLKNKLLNNIETEESKNSGENTTENCNINNIYSISKTMYIFHSYKKMFYYSVR